MDAREQSPPNIVNFRELGGLTTDDGRIVRSGVLFRSGHHGKATSDDHVVLAGHSIRTVIDLRTDEDVEAEGADVVADGVTALRFPIGDEAGATSVRAVMASGDVELWREHFAEGRSFEMAREGSIRFVTQDDMTPKFATVMAAIRDYGDGPLLWHCSAGKDRAGWTATALGLLLGVPRQALEAHYLDSNRGRSMTGWDGEQREWFEPFLLVQPEYVRGQFTAVDERWGSIEALFVDGYGWTEADIAHFRDRMLV